MIKKFYLATTLLLALVATMLPNAFAQQKLSGKVTDQSGVVIGAAVMVQGTTNGAVTEGDGTYTLNNVPANAKIEISCLGYKTQVIEVGGRAVINVTLVEDTEMVEETVVIGYAVQKKSDVTGAVASIKSEELQNRMTEDLGHALMGKAAGVQVLSVSGAPGEGTSIRVRGFSSNSSGASDPLYIVDGMKVSNINYIDTHNIESIEVLKDAASAAIYGAEAGNGVVLITTKAGKKGEGQIFFNAAVGFQNNASGIKVMNAEEFVNFQTAIGRGSMVSSWNTNLIDGKKVDTNWLDEGFETGIMQRYTVGAQGGNDKGNYYAAITYLGNDGMITGNKDYMKRFSGQFNASYKIKPWLQLQSNLTVDHADKGTMEMNHVEQGNVIGSIFQSIPIVPVEVAATDLDRWGMGSLPTYQLIQSREGYYYTPECLTFSEMTPFYINYERRTERNSGDGFRGIFSGILTPFKGFTFTSRFGFNFGTNEYYNYTRPYWGGAQVNSATTLGLNNQVSKSWSIQWENFANYAFKIGGSDFTAMAGMSYRESASLTTGVSVDHLTNETDPVYRYVSNATAAATKSIQGGTPSEATQIGYFGRLTWSYKGRYNAQINFRADAFDASKLSKKARWGYFPSASIGWTPSNENFFKDNISPEAWSYFKIRASYGKNGNVNVLSGYPYAATLMTSSKTYPLNGTQTNVQELNNSRLPNEDLKWEESVQLDLGVDFRFFRDRLSFTVDYYNKNTNNLLVSVAPPKTTGASSVYKNLGLINNQGFEFELSWKQQVGDFSYSIAGNLATLKNVVADLGGLGRQSGATIHSSSLTATYIEEGYPLWYMRGYKYEGFDPQTGEPKYKDVNGNGYLDADDKEMIGSAIPDFTYGLTLNFAWKGLDLSVVASGQAGAEMWLVSYRPNRNQIKEYWTESYYAKGANAKYPAYNNDNWDYWLMSSGCVYNSDFFKVKQVQLGYTFPAKWTKKIAIESLRIFGSLDNYFTFTKYPGPDPEIVRNGSQMGMDQISYPVAKNATIGVNITF